MSNESASSPPILRTVHFDGTEFHLLGTAHVSRQSVEDVRRALRSGDYNAVAIELCPSRHATLVDPQSLARLDLLKTIRDGKGGMVAASLALGAYQQRIAEQFGIEPGAEMRCAIDEAKAADLPLLLVDREIGVTLKRVYRRVPWWQRATLAAGLVAGLLSRERVPAEEIERLKQGDLLEATFAEFASRSPLLYDTLIAERDRYMAAKLLSGAAGRYDKVLVVVGAGHVDGLARELDSFQGDPWQALAELQQLPPPSRWPRVIPWLIVALILAGFAYGFSRDWQLGWRLIAEWTLINGVLCAAGSLLARGHPFTIAASFVAAPLTSLNPTIGAGFVAAAVELGMRKPTVADFSRLRNDVSRLGGWWRNRVARVLLVFILATLGSAAGTHVAGFRIAEQLLAAS